MCISVCIRICICLCICMYTHMKHHIHTQSIPNIVVAFAIVVHTRQNQRFTDVHGRRKCILCTLLRQPSMAQPTDPSEVELPLAWVLGGYDCRSPYFYHKGSHLHCGRLNPSGTNLRRVAVQVRDHEGGGKKAGEGGRPREKTRSAKQKNEINQRTGDISRERQT